MIALTLICTLNTFILGLCLTVPKHFYNVDENQSRMLYIDTETDFVRKALVDMSPGFPFLQISDCSESECGEDMIFDYVTIHKNGMIHVGRYYYAVQPSDFPQNYKPGIAPFWAPLNLEDGSMVFYQKTTERRMMKLIERDVGRNFKCAAEFKPTTVLIVTWFNVTHVQCDFKTNQDRCNCLMHYTERRCYCRHEYSPKDYCNCQARNEICPCTITEMELDPHWNPGLFHDAEMDKYCQCLAEYNDEFCDCIFDYPYDMEFCDCMRRRNHYSTCYCFSISYSYYSEDHCACIYSHPYVLNCNCYDYHTDEYCQCLVDYIKAEFDDYQRIDVGYGNDFCDCVTTDRSLSACFCSPNVDKNVKYCTCLFDYESFLEGRGANHTVIHRFCLCMVNASDPVQCGCESCPSTRSLDYQLDDFSVINEEMKMLAIHPRDAVSGHNAFQALLITDGVQSYVMFNYGSIDVTTDNKGRYPVTVGIGGKGNEQPYFNHRFSRNKHLPQLLWKSNVGVSGRWMYRVDGKSVQEPQDCI